MDLRALVREHLGEEVVSGLVPGRILAIDDDPGNLIVLEEFLADEYSVTSTTSPKEALELLQEQEFDMVISDQRMPEITGVELLGRVRELHPDTIRVIISAYSDAKAILAAINVGEVYRFILKPWEPQEVEEVVKQGLEFRMHRLVIQRLVDELAVRNSKLATALAELQETQSKLVYSARLATVGQLTSGIVRELKNHVTGVQLLADAIADRTLPEDLVDYVQLGVNSAQSLFDLIGGLNAFASPDASWKLKRNRCSIQGIITTAMQVVNLDSRIGSRKLIQNVSPDVQDIIADEQKLRQVVANLTLNAVDATGSGGRIEVRALAIPGGVEIRVLDNGKGMHDDLLKKIQDPFVTTRDGTLGLGLQVCLQVVEAHGGKLVFESVEGRGTLARVRLPKQPLTSRKENK